MLLVTVLPGGLLFWCSINLIRNYQVDGALVTRIDWTRNHKYPQQFLAKDTDRVNKLP